MPGTSSKCSNSCSGATATAAANGSSSHQRLRPHIDSGDGSGEQQQHLHQQLAFSSGSGSGCSASCGPLKAATVSLSAALVLRRGIGGGARNPGGPIATTGGPNCFGALSPPLPSLLPLLRHISPPELSTVDGGCSDGGGHGAHGCRRNYAAASHSISHHHISSSCSTVTSSPSHPAHSPQTHPPTTGRHRACPSSGSAPPHRRTVSLDSLHSQRPAVVVFISQPQHQHQLHMLSQAANASATAGDDSSTSTSTTSTANTATTSAGPSRAVLLVDKATQTLESYLEHQQQLDDPDDQPNACEAESSESVAGQQQQQQQSSSAASSPCGASGELKIEKALRQRLQQRSASGGGITVVAVVGTQLSAVAGGCAGGSACGAEHSVSSQTLSPQHAKAIPMTIPIRPHPTSGRPMRSSVEGLNQEIEKLVLQPDQPHTCRPETNLFSRGETPEGHRAPLSDFLHETGAAAAGSLGGASSAFAVHGDRRSVNTQTPSREFLSSDESQSTSPDDCASSSGTGASPRINRFLAREPPDGCEKVSLKLTDADQPTGVGGHAHLFKPSGFRLRPSLGSAFQPIIASSRSSQELPTEAEAEAADLLETIERDADDATAAESGVGAGADRD